MSTELANRTDPKPALKVLLARSDIQARIKEVLGDRASEFGASVVSLANSSQRLMDCDPNSVIASCMTAALLHLPIDKNLGFAHIVPYAGVAQFQMGYKGFIQLAMRTAQYRHLNACPVFEGELVKYDRLSGEVVIDENKKKSETIIGYAAYFELTNGFKHSLYWRLDQVEAHAKRFSQAYQKKKQDSPWFTAFDAMALKTVIKALLSKWGILSIEMQRAIREDQGIRRVVDMNADPDYPDGTSAAALFDRPEVSMPKAVPSKRGKKASQEPQNEGSDHSQATATPSGTESPKGAQRAAKAGASGELPLESKIADAPLADGATGRISGRIDAISAKPTSAGGKRYACMVGENWYATFDEKKAVAIVKGDTVQIDFSEGKHGFDIEAIKTIREAAGADA